MLFNVTGGFDRPLETMEPIRRFYDCFLAGYEQENHIDDLWLKRMNVLMDYRRLLLYTIMQDWLESDQKVGGRFLHMMENPCQLEIL